MLLHSSLHKSRIKSNENSLLGYQKSNTNWENIIYIINTALEYYSRDNIINIVSELQILKVGNRKSLRL